MMYKVILCTAVAYNTLHYEILTLKIAILIQRKYIHWKNTENHTENLSLLFKYWILHFANHTEKLLITLKNC